MLYVGMTLHSAKKRLKAHVYDASYRPPRTGVVRRNSRLHNAIRVYGHEGAKLTELAYADDWIELQKLEQEFIAKLNTRSPNGYNLTIGGQGGIPKHTEETRKRLSEFHRGRVRSPEHCKNISAAKMGHAVSTETRAKISAAVMGKNKGKAISEEQKRLISLANKGRKRTPEQRARISAATKAAVTPEYRARISKAKTGNSYAKGHTVPYESKVLMRMGAAFNAAKQAGRPYSELRITA